MKQENDLPALQLQADEALRETIAAGLCVQPPGSAPLPLGDAAADASHWFDGQPARALLSFLQPMRAALRVSGVEAADALLAPLALLVYGAALQETAAKK